MTVASDTPGGDSDQIVRPKHSLFANERDAKHSWAKRFHRTSRLFRLPIPESRTPDIDPARNVRFFL